MTSKMQYCGWCGEELGEYSAPLGEIESCGKPECNRECNDIRRGQDQIAQENAAEDNWERYR